MTQLFLLLADQAPEGGQSPTASMAPMFILGLVMLFLVMVVFPAQRRQKKDQEKLVATLKRGAKVLTSGGIVGIVISAKDGEDEVVIRSEESRLRIKRNVVIQVLGSDEAEANKG
jgi:preprotein translocase subunit YajC